MLNIAAKSVFKTYFYNNKAINSFSVFVTKQHAKKSGLIIKKKLDSFYSITLSLLIHLIDIFFSLE